MLPSGHPERLPEGLNILGAIFLARLLTPAEFGIYAIIVFIRGFLTAFSDAGLAASLIRQPVEPDEEDYRAIFTFQQMMVLGVAVPFWLACPLVAHLYKLPVHDAWVFRLVDLSLLCSSFQVIPSTKLERDLAFHKIAVIEISMALVFNGVSVFLSYQGWGDEFCLGAFFTVDHWGGLGKRHPAMEDRMALGLEAHPRAHALRHSLSRHRFYLAHEG